jgi:hypothetical protein
VPGCGIDEDPVVRSLSFKRISLLSVIESRLTVSIVDWLGTLAVNGVLPYWPTFLSTLYKPSLVREGRYRYRDKRRAM